MTRLTETDVFVIGDCHGHVDRLEALLLKAKCDEKDCKIVQLGDLGHFGADSSPTGDLMCWQQARDGWIDYVLWGNHDRAVVDPHHAFAGYQRPLAEVKHIMKLMALDGRLLMALDVHGWLVTHAGLHAQFKYNRAGGIDKTDPGTIAEWLNKRGNAEETEPVIDAISSKRGGRSPYGGILWRDISERLYGMRQVFGHSASYKHQIRGQKNEWWCIDIGGKGGRSDPDAECLAGIWLPSQQVVRVDMNKENANEVFSTAGLDPSAN